MAERSHPAWPGAFGEADGTAIPPRFSDELETWLQSDADKTVGDLIGLFEARSFAVLFLLLLAPSALPLPTGGLTQVLEVIAILLALQLVVNRKCVWLPQRWKALELGGDKRGRFLAGLIKVVRRLEGVSRPRLRFVFGHQLSNVVFGVLVIAGSLGALLAVPFSGLDTLPALGVVLVSVGVLLEDFGVVVTGTVAILAGIALEIVVGWAALEGLKGLV